MKTTPESSTSRIEVVVDAVHVDEAIGLLVDEHVARVGDRHELLALARWCKLREEVGERDADLLEAGAGEPLERGLEGLLHLDLDHRVLERCGRETPPEPPAPFAAPSCLGSGLRSVRCRSILGFAGRSLPLIGFVQRLEQTSVGKPAGSRLDFGDTVLVQLGDGLLEEVADDGLDIAADVADLGELRRLHLDEGRLGETRNAPRDLRLADAGRADHEDVLGQHLVAHVVAEHPPPDAVAQRDRDGSLRLVLADDVFVKTAHHLGGAKRLAGHGLDEVVRRARLRLVFGHRFERHGSAHSVLATAGAGTAVSRVSTVMLSLV